VDDDLALALDLAGTADEISMAHFRQRGLAVETKADETFVTEADRAIERALRDRLAGARPDDGVVGEEFGGRIDDGDGPARTWILDPIDGTNNYLRGIPVFATLIALRDAGEVTAAVVSAPALGRRWWATRGGGAFADGERIRVSGVDRLERSLVTYSSVRAFESHGLGDGVRELIRRCWRSRGFGDFWMHVLVAEGAVEIAAEPEVALWDLAAPMLIVQEAGGRFTDLSGRATPDGGSALSTNGLLHDQALSLLAP
jgi:histidinol-phosphatase